VFELEKAADIISAVAFDQPQRALGQRVAGFTPREYTGQVLFAQINDRDQLGVAADAAIMDFLVHAVCSIFSSQEVHDKSSEITIAGLNLFIRPVISYIARQHAVHRKR
jgi:hypothetical protein